MPESIIGVFRGSLLLHAKGRHVVLVYEDIDRAMDQIADQVRQFRGSSMVTVAKMCFIESIEESKTRVPLHLSRSNN